MALVASTAADGDVTMFEDAASNETRELKIYGYRDADSPRSLEIGVGVDAADTASFDGLSNYLFDGVVKSNSGAQLGDGGTTNYTQFSATGVQTFHGTARIDWTKKTATSITKGNGTHSGTTGDTTGHVEDLDTFSDGDRYKIVEVNATPGLEVEIHFTSVTAFNWVQCVAVYKAGTNSHTVSAMLYNWVTATWDCWNELDLHGNDRVENYSFFVPDDSPYIGTGADAGKVDFKFSHTMGGLPGHEFWVDVVALY